jgi:crossover junction endonuclease EME1
MILISFREKRAFWDSSFCMDVGQVKTGANKDDIYLKMLQEIVRVTAPAASGIASRYPSVAALVRVFREAGPLILEDLKVGILHSLHKRHS